MDPRFNFLVVVRYSGRLGMPRGAMPARILLVDDHESVRSGVRTLFANNDLLEVCGEAQNGTDEIRMVSDLSPDVVILDLTMPE